jgi:hypothetical protein
MVLMDSPVLMVLPWVLIKLEINSLVNYKNKHSLLKINKSKNNQALWQHLRNFKKVP